VKHPETQKYLSYFRGENTGYQDLYQLCLFNDLRHGVKKMIYIIPSNFLFGYSVSNKIRNDFLPYYRIKKTVILEKEVFEYTGTNVMICVFERKDAPRHEVFSFEGIKINKRVQEKQYTISPKNQYRAGGAFEEFVNDCKAIKPLQIKYYLTKADIEKNRGGFEVEVLDVSHFKENKYPKIKVYVNEYLLNRLRGNPLFVRTVDTGTLNGRAGLYVIKEVFGVEGILVTDAPYRTHPIQLFIDPSISITEHMMLKDYFNLVLEYFREKTDSEFMTTYKYSNSEYTRKYLGLSQARKLLQTFPLLSLNAAQKDHLKTLVNLRNTEEIIGFIRSINENKGLDLWL